MKRELTGTSREAGGSLESGAKRWMSAVVSHLHTGGWGWGVAGRWGRSLCDSEMRATAAHELIVGKTRERDGARIRQEDVVAWVEV